MHHARVPATRLTSVACVLVGATLSTRALAQTAAPVAAPAVTTVIVVQRTVEDEYLHPAPGRAPLVVESDRPQSVGIPIANLESAVGERLATAHRDLCTTPCTLYVRPGTFALWTGGRGVRDAVSEITVPAAGWRVRMRAPTKVAYGLAYAVMLTGVATVGVGVGGLALADAPSLSRSERQDFVIGSAVVTSVGAAMMIAGTAVMIANRSGVASTHAPTTERLAAPPPVSLGFAPTPGGAFAAAALRF